MADHPSQVLEATESFVCELDGERFMVNAGTTRIAAEHRLAQAYPDRFQSVDEGLSYETEEATNEPGRARNRGRQVKASGSDQPTKAEQGSSGQSPGETTGLSTQTLRQTQSGQAKGKGDTPTKEA